MTKEEELPEERPLTTRHPEKQTPAVRHSETKPDRKMDLAPALEAVGQTQDQVPGLVLEAKELTQKRWQTCTSRLDDLCNEQALTAHSAPIAEFSCTLEHQAGQNHKNADRLSRQACEDCRQCKLIERRDGVPHRQELEQVPASNVAGPFASCFHFQ